MKFLKGWKKVQLFEIAQIERGRFSARPRNDPQFYGGEIPFIQTGDISRCNGILKDWNQTLNNKGLGVSKLFPKGSLAITIAANIGDVAEIEFSFACPDSLVIIQPFPEVNVIWLKHMLINAKSYFRARATQNAQANINLEVIKPLTMTLPPIHEQKAIATILSTWDEAIERTERLIRLKEISFQKLLSSKISDKLFKTRKLGKAIQEISQRNQAGISRVLSVTNHSGFVLPENQFERRVASQNLENYKVVCKGQYAYNPSRINVGSIAKLDQWDIGVLSPMYVVFKIDETVIHSDFLYYWLQTKETRKRICTSTQGSVRESVNFNDFANLIIPLPELKVQQEIIYELNLVEAELNNSKKIREKLHLQKQGLMQKLLTGKWRVKVNLKEKNNDE